MTGGFWCRGCGNTECQPVLSLGETPLANALLRPDQLTAPEPRFPLDLVLCPSCTLLQITATVPPAELFSEYVYFSSFSDTAVANARALVEAVVAERQLDSRSLVLEVASNDGYLLKHYVTRGIPVLGIEPARNIATIAEQNGVRTLNAFFGPELAARLAADGHRADVIHANNVLAHVPDPRGFVSGLAALLAERGVAIVEVPYVKDMLDRVEFDTIYHEHLSYFSVTSLERLFASAGVTLYDVERLAIHGGSLRLFVAAGVPQHASVGALLREEAEWGAGHPQPYRAFAARVQRLRRELGEMLQRLKAAGSRIAAYGASAKGTTLLNFCGIGRETLDFVVDRSTVKQGLFTPGTHLPVSPPERLLEEQPDYVLLLTWNFEQEILRQQAEYRRRGGRFIVPVPSPRIL